MIAMGARALRVLALAGLAGVAHAAAPDDVPGLRIDPATGAETWEIGAHGVALRLTQILPDQVRAFYLSRGFAAEDAELYAAACVFMTVLRNDAAPGALNFRLADWQVRVRGERRVPRPVEDWLALWQQRGVPQPARIAFRWAQFPSEQEYEPGEWNQGMLAVGLPPGERFDLAARWQLAGKTEEGVLTDVRCAPR